KEGSLSPIGERYHEVRAEETLRRVAARAGWGQPKPPGVGRGLAFGNKHPHGGGDPARPPGQGGRDAGIRPANTPVRAPAHTVLKQIVAEQLGVPLTQVAVRAADTTVFPYDRGVGGSRITQMVGGALVQAAGAVQGQLADSAADLLGCPPDAVQWRGGAFFAGGGSESVSFA